MKTTFFLLFWYIAISVASAQMPAQILSIQYDPTTKKGFFQKVIEISPLDGMEMDVKRRIIDWTTKRCGFNFEGKSIFDKYIKGSTTYPQGITVANGKKNDLSYDFQIETTDKKCTLTITNMVNRDNVLFGAIENQAFKEDGSRRTNPARVSVVESIEQSMTQVAISLERAIKTR